MIALLQAMEFWHWWILAVVLMILEVILPGFVLLWMGVSAAVVGLLVLVLPLSWEVQWLIFAVLSVASVIGGRYWIARNPASLPHPTLNRRGQAYVGRTFTLDAPIDNGVGKLTVDDTTWKIAGADLPAGTKVRVTGVAGTALTVEAES